MNRLATRSGFAGLLLTLSTACSSGASSDGPAVQTEVTRGLETAERVAVVLNLREPGDGNMRRARDSIVASAGPGLDVTRRFNTLPALAARIDPLTLERVRSDPRIESIQVERSGQGLLQEAVAAVGANTVHDIYGLTGKGVRVAVVDTGVDVSHPDLEGAIAVQRCFVQGGCPPFSTDEGESAADDNGHGTSMSGIVASRGIVSSRGFAPEAEIVSIKVMNSWNRGEISDFGAALEWLYDNLATLNVRIISISFGTDLTYENNEECEQAQLPMARAINRLANVGVAVFAAAGNKASTTSLAAPACMANVIAVGATYDADVGAQPEDEDSYTALGYQFADCRDETTAANQMTCFTNAGPLLDILAPGAPIVTDAPSRRTVKLLGTSPSAPAAAGVAALMLQCNPQLTAEQIKQAMIATGEMSLDPRTGDYYPSLRAAEAVRFACPDIEPPEADPAPGPPDARPPSATPPGPDAGAAGANAGSSLPGPGTAAPSGADRDARPLGARYRGGAAAPQLPNGEGSGTRDDAVSEGGEAREDTPPESKPDGDYACALVPGEPRGQPRWAWALGLAAAAVSCRARARSVRGSRTKRS